MLCISASTFDARRRPTTMSTRRTIHRTSLFHAIILATLAVVSIKSLPLAASDDGSDSSEEERGMAKLLGGREEAKRFIETVWGGDLPYFVPASSSNDGDSTDLLWSLGLSEHYLKNNNGNPWEFEEDIKIVKDGKVYYEASEPGTWKDVQMSLIEGATVVMHNLQFRHDPIHRLCAELEDELEIFLGANSYLTPAGSTGFDPHYDWHDILVLQLEGTKTWTVCEQRGVNIYKHRQGMSRQVLQRGGDFGNCTELVFRPGDLFYAPLGTIHYAKANEQNETEKNNPESYSMHLTLSLIRQQFTWGQFLTDVLESQTRDFSARLSLVIASNKKLQAQIPISLLHEIAYSLGNEDLPPDFIEKLRGKAKLIVQDELSSSGQLGTTLKTLLDSSNDVFEETVHLFRFKMVMGRLKEKFRCPSKNYPGDLRTLSFRRLPHQRMMLQEDDHVGSIIVTGETKEDLIVLPLRWSDGIRYALGTLGAGGKYFTAQDLVVNAKMKDGEAIKMIQELLNACLLDWSIKDASSPPQDESCVA